MSKSLEFIVEDKPNSKVEKEHSKIVFFKIMPESLQNTRDRPNVPRFCISGRLDSLYCKLSEPLTGEVCIDNFFFAYFIICNIALLLSVFVGSN